MTQSADPTSDFADRPWMEGAASPPKPGAKKAPRVILQDRGWLVACHLAPLLLWVLYPYGCAALVPLLIWQVKARKEGNRRLTSHAIEALNFQLNLTLLGIALTITIIGVLLIPFVLVTGIVFATIASIKTYRGQDYRYPYIYRLIKEDDAVSA
ncbi:MAG: putative Tic20 family protein [Candidatus Paceibacteria bacterium]|jgi:uncharacterized Tic20 family protein